MSGLKAQTHMRQLPTETIVTRPGTVKSKTLRVVCTTCNNEWMSQLEVEAKPFLIPMMQGKPLMLAAAALTKVRRWATLKLMIAEFHRPEHSVLTVEDRSAFREYQKVPANMSIWLGKCCAEDWQARLVMQSADLVLKRFAHLHDGRSIQTTAMGFGQILLHAVVRKPIAPDLDAGVTFHVGMFRLWPSTLSAAYWPPPGRELSAKDAEYIARRLQLELGKTQTEWRHPSQSVSES
jgi:hypothetical protein